MAKVRATAWIEGDQAAMRASSICLISEQSCEQSFLISMVIRSRMSQVQVHMLDASSTNASRAFGRVGVLCDGSSLAE